MTARRTATLSCGHTAPWTRILGDGGTVRCPRCGRNVPTVQRANQLAAAASMEARRRAAFEKSLDTGDSDPVESST